MLSLLMIFYRRLFYWPWNHIPLVNIKMSPEGFEPPTFWSEASPQPIGLFRRPVCSAPSFSRTSKLSYEPVRNIAYFRFKRTYKYRPKEIIFMKLAALAVLILLIALIAGCTSTSGPAVQPLHADQSSGDRQQDQLQDRKSNQPYQASQPYLSFNE